MVRGKGCAARSALSAAARDGARVSCQRHSEISMHRRVARQEQRRMSASPGIPAREWRASAARCHGRSASRPEGCLRRGSLIIAQHRGKSFPKRSFLFLLAAAAAGLLLLALGFGDGDELWAGARGVGEPALDLRHLRQQRCPSMHSREPVERTRCALRGSCCRSHPVDAGASTGPHSKAPPPPPHFFPTARVGARARTRARAHARTHAHVAAHSSLLACRMGCGYCCSPIPSVRSASHTASYSKHGSRAAMPRCPDSFAQ